MPSEDGIIRVVLAVGPALVRAGLKSLLSESDVLVVGEATDWAATVALVSSLRPDVLILDFDLCPGKGGRFERLQKCVKQLRSVKLVVVGPVGLVAGEAKLLGVGVSGYLPKMAASAAEFALCVRRVAAGGVYIATTALEDSSFLFARDLSRLSPRQVDVLQAIAEGLTTKQIGLRLRISVKTVESHRMNLMERLEIFDVVGLVKFALKVGLVGLD